MTTRTSTWKRRALALGATAAVAAGLLLTAGTAANAAPATGTSSAAALAACTLKAYQPSFSGHAVHAGAQSAGCWTGNSFGAVLERDRWFGWESTASTTWGGNGYHSLTHNCKPGDVYTYRVHAYNRNGGGDVYGPTKRGTC